jgi:hypothetical protein
MRSTKPLAGIMTKWSQREYVATPQRTEEPTITRMGPVDPPPPTPPVRSASSTSSGIMPVHTTVAMAAQSSTMPGAKSPAAPEKMERSGDVTISRQPTASSADRTTGRLVRLPDPEMLSGSPKSNASQTSSDVKPVTTTAEMVTGPSLEVTDSRPAKPRELKPGMDEIASPKPLTATTTTANRNPSGPVVRLVNKKRITLNYEVKDVGPSGVSGVELWYTRDAKDWKRHDSAPETKPPYIIEVQEEGLYGFTLLAKNGIGLSKDPPRSGDLPQVWVEVDLTRPTVAVTDVKAGYSDKAPILTVQWKANDKNLGGQPITVSYAEKENGPWQPIVTNVENTGRCAWPLRPGVPPKLFVRVEARDLAGNVGAAQTPAPVQVDMSRPTVNILDVEAVGR